MKKLLTILLAVCLCGSVYAGGTEYITGSETFMKSHGVPDSAGTGYTPADSVEVTVMFQDGTESMGATWFNNADDQAVLSNGKLYFYDVWTDMNGSDSLGTYTVTMNWYDGSGAALPYEEVFTIRQITNTVEATFALVIANGDLSNYDGATPLTEDSNIGVDWSDIANTGAGVALSNTVISSVAFVTGSVADLLAISGSVAAANNLETFFDDTGSQFTNFDNMYNGTGYAGGTIEFVVDLSATGVDDVWDEVLTGPAHNVQNSAGKRLRAVASDVISDGTGRGAPDGNTFLLAIAESAADDFYNGHLLKIISGTGISQERLIEDYTGATDSITLHAGGQDAWTTNPANNDLYEIIGAHAVEVVHMHDPTVNMVAGVSADSVWHADTSSHNGTAGSYGLILAKPSYVQGAGADSSPSAWDATDSLIVMSIVAETTWTRSTRTITGDTYTPDVNIASVNTNALESGDFEDGFLKVAKIDDGAFTAAKFATNAFTAVKFADAVFDSANFNDDFFRAMKKFIWADTLDGVREDESAEDRILKILAHLDGSIPLDSATFETDFWTAIENLSVPDTNRAGDSLAIQPEYWTAADSAAYQGAASGLSVGDIADTLIALGVTLGDGSSACTTYVYDTGASAVVADIQIKFYNSSNVGAALGYTNSDGYQIFEMDNGTYTLSVPSNSGYIQTTNPETLVVAAGLTDTIEVTAFDPGSPTAGGTGRLYGRIHDMTGTVLEGAIVTVTIPDKFKYLTYSGIVITPFNRADTTDSNGDWSIDVYKYNGLSDTTAYYIVTANEPSSGQIIGGEIFSVGYRMPNLTQHKLTFGSDYDQDLD